MKLHFRKEKLPDVGSRRRVSKFLWLPLIINREFRWLEWVTFEEEVYLKLMGDMMEVWHEPRWRKVCFVENESF